MRGMSFNLVVVRSAAGQDAVGFRALARPLVIKPASTALIQVAGDEHGDKGQRIQATIFVHRSTAKLMPKM